MVLTSSSNPGEFSEILESSCRPPAFSRQPPLQLPPSCPPETTTLHIDVHSVCSWEEARSTSSNAAILDPPKPQATPWVNPGGATSQFKNTACPREKERALCAERARPVGFPADGRACTCVSQLRPGLSEGGGSEELRLSRSLLPHYHKQTERGDTPRWLMFSVSTLCQGRKTR